MQHATLEALTDSLQMRMLIMNDIYRCVFHVNDWCMCVCMLALYVSVRKREREREAERNMRKVKIKSFLLRKRT